MTSSPRLRLPTDGRLVLASSTLAPRAGLHVGDGIVGVDEDGRESHMTVTGVARVDGPAAHDVVMRDGAGTVSVEVCVGGYDASRGEYAQRLRIELRAADGGPAAGA